MNNGQRSEAFSSQGAGRAGSQQYVNEISSKQTTNEAVQGNFPSPGDSTSSGGYGSARNVWSDRAQRGNNDTGLLDQSTSGTNLKPEMQDAQQGVDADTRRDSRGLNPYGKSSLASKAEAEDRLASAFRQ